MRVETKVSQSVLLLLFLLIGCARPAQSMSVDEILMADIQVPVHHLNLDENPAYGSLETTYYYSEPSEVYLKTYFSTQDSAGKIIHVAMLSTCLYCSPPIHTDPNQPKPREVASESVIWALDGFTGVCDWVVDPFQSCVYWFDTSGDHLLIYTLYTVWSEKETVEFANSLSVLEAGD